MKIENFNNNQFSLYAAFLKSTGLSDASIKRKLSSLTNFQKYLIKKNLIQTQNPPVDKSTSSLKEGGSLKTIILNLITKI